MGASAVVRISVQLHRSLTHDWLTVTTQGMRSCSARSVMALAVMLLAGCQPHGVEALRRGDELQRAGKFAEAIPLLQQAAADMASEPRVWNVLGLAYHGSGHSLEAQRAYLQALKEDRNFAQAHFNLGLLFSEQGEWLEVERSFRAFLAVEANQGNPVAWRLLGEAQWHNRAFDQAQRSLAVAAKLDARNPDVWNLLGVVEISRRHFAEARQNLGYAVYLNPRHPSAVYNLAVLSQQQFNDRKAAAGLYRNYLNLVPTASNADAIRNLIRDLEAAPSPTPVSDPRRAGDPPRVSGTNASVPVLPSVGPASPAVPHPPPAAVDGPKPARSVAGISASDFQTVSTNASRPAVSPPRKVSLSVSNSPQDLPSSLTAMDRTPQRATNVLDTNPVTPAEIVRILEDPPLRAAPGVARLPETQPQGPPVETPHRAEVGSNPPPTTVSSPSLAESKVSDPTSNGASEKPGFWSRLNPVRWGNPRRWFGRSGDEVASRGPVYEPAPAAVAPPVRSLPPTGKAPRPEIRRYPRAYASGLVAGDRAGAEARFADGSDAWDAGNRLGALAAYRQAVAADPTFYPAQYNLAVVAMNLGDTATAVQAAEASVLSDPLSASAHRVFAAALVQRDFPADAAEELETFLQLQPDDADVHLAVAGLYANKLGEPTRARAHYERVLALRPQHPQAAQVSAWLAGR